MVLSGISVKATKITITIPNDLLEVVGKILNGKAVMNDYTPDVWERATTIVFDIADKIRAMSRTTDDNHMAFIPHGNSIDREE